MKKYIIPETVLTSVVHTAFLCSSPGAGIKGDAPGISGGGTQMAPRRNVF